MSLKKQKFNWKSRQRMKTTIIDDPEVKKIKIDLEGQEQETYDEANTLVLPSKKRQTIVKPDGPVVSARKLSKKQRKRLQHVIEVKEKKQRRAELLESLSKVQASAQEIALLKSTTDLHRGNKHVNLSDKARLDPGEKITANALVGSNRKRKAGKDNQKAPVPSSSDETETSSEESESDSSVEDNEEELSEETVEAKEESLLLDDSQAAKPPENISAAVRTFSLSDDGPKLKDNESGSATTRSVINVPVNRKAEMQEQRLKLPILGEEQVVMEFINENAVVILCGETGSGKTTQVPQFLYEAGYAHGEGMIAVTEPRRVAAISMSKRVAHELNLPTSEVSYQIRYEGNVTERTRIKFMTDGVLLKEVQRDFLLSKYSVVIIDEAHERSVYTDILIGLLSRIVPVRNKRGQPLKLIIMSATLRVEDFTENPRLFKVTPPVVKVESRQFPVTVHFNKRTPLQDYLGEAFKKVCKIHRKLPEGGILVFVTGQQEVHTLCAKLRRAFPFKDGQKQTKVLRNHNKRSRKDSKSDKHALPRIDLDDYSIIPDEEEAELVGDQSDGSLSDGAELDMIDSDGEMADSGAEPLYPLPLYSLLSTEKQNRVFEKPPEGCRLCVVATNVAETSITIPNIKYVVDTGRTKTKFYDKVTGVSTFKVTWTSQASANQRAGRAGRTSAGHCYRLYSSAVFNDEFEKFSPPEITRRPVDDLVLQMKAMCIDKVLNFPFPTPPSEESVRAAEKLLLSLGALQKSKQPSSFKEAKKLECAAKISAYGKTMAAFPVAPRYGKMLALAHQHDLLAYVVALVSALSVQEVFIAHARGDAQDVGESAEKNPPMRVIQKTWAGVGNSLLLGDACVLLKAVGACEYVGASPAFCEQHGIRYKAMLEIRKLRAQLTNAVNAVFPQSSLVVDPQLEPPSDTQCQLLRQIVLAGLADHVARKLVAPPAGTEDAKRLKYAYQCTTTEDPVYIHPESVLYKCDKQFVVYQDIHETSRLYMKGVTVVEPSWLALFAANHCTFSGPLDHPPPRYDPDQDALFCHVTATFGAHSWALENVEIRFPEGPDRTRWFARFLLEGAVIPQLEKYSSTLLLAPATMVKSWSKLHARTEKLFHALYKEGVHNKTTLYSQWKQSPNYLLKEYCSWIPEALHYDVTKLWPPVH